MDHITTILVTLMCLMLLNHMISCNRLTSTIKKVHVRMKPDTNKLYNRVCELCKAIVEKVISSR